VLLRLLDITVVLLYRFIHFILYILLWSYFDDVITNRVEAVDGYVE